MTDGCVKTNYNAVTLSSKDKDWIEDIKNILCPEIKIYFYNGSYQIGIYSKELKEWLVNKGCTPNKSLTLKFPNVPEQYLPDFIRGCIDGDGSIGFNKGVCRTYLCGSSLLFLEKYSKILTKYNIKNYLYNTHQSDTSIINGKIINRTSDHWRVETARKESKKLLNWIYYPGHKLSLKRKKINAETILNFNPNPIGRKPNIEKQLQAKLLRKLGLTLKEIAIKLKTSVSRIHYWTK